MPKTSEIYDLILDLVAVNDDLIDDFIVGLTWTYCHSSTAGLCMTADSRSRTFEWAGELRGKKVSELAN